MALLCNAKEGQLPFFCHILGLKNYTPFITEKGVFPDGEKTAKN
jgi:hypothetical protein